MFLLYLHHVILVNVTLFISNGKSKTQVGTLEFLYCEEFVKPSFYEIIWKHTLSQCCHK